MENRTEGLKKLGLAAAAVATVGAGVVGAVAIAGAASGQGTAVSYGYRFGGYGAPGGASHDHTPVTGAELTGVTDAVAAYDDSVAVQTVVKDPDGSYDVIATKDGAPIVLEVSADLGTVTERTGGPGSRGGFGSPGGPGGPSDPAVTGAELTKVTDAVTTHDATLTVQAVRMDPDGSYDVFATQDDGTPTMLEVSADLKTITENTGPPGGFRGPGGPGGPSDPAVTGAELTKVTDAVTAHDATLTVQTVRKDPDGSYDVFATQDDGTPTMLEVSADLKTITENTGPPGGFGDHGGFGGHDGFGRGGYGGPDDALPGGTETPQTSVT